MITTTHTDEEKYALKIERKQKENSYIRELSYITTFSFWGSVELKGACLSAFMLLMQEEMYSSLIYILH